ncbi:hypothetical protein RB213_010713 [Colletotrichum asianum]
MGRKRVSARGFGSSFDSLTRYSRWGEDAPQTTYTVMAASLIPTPRSLTSSAHILF